MIRNQAVALVALHSILRTNGGVPPTLAIWRRQSGLDDGPFRSAVVALGEAEIVRIANADVPAAYGITAKGRAAIAKAVEGISA